MTTRVPIRYGGTGANTASDARTALGVPPLAAYDVANSASSTANAAYSQANTAYSAANTANTNALNAYSQANASYGQANTAYGQANDAYAAANTANTNALNAYAQANAAYGQANAAYNAANNAQVTVYANNASNVTTQRINFVNTATVTVSVTADSSNANIAFTAAPQTVVNDTYTAAGNTAAAATANIANGLYAISTSAYDQANTARGQANTAYGQANDAYAAANTANTNALNAYSQANAAYGQANTAYGQANDAYAQANTARGTANSAYGQANNAYAQANDAYAAANTANTNALAAYGQANLAYTQANAAYNQANAAYAEANLKLNLTGGTINGSLNVSGNLTITGNTSYINVSTLNVSDPIIFIAANNDTSDIVDIGFVGGKNTGGSFTHTGLVRDAGDGTWYLFDNLLDAGHVNNVIDFANTTLALLRANINANSILLTGNAVATQANLTLASNQANTANAQANLARDTANAAYGQANSAYGQANLAYAQANSNYLPAVTRLNVTAPGLYYSIDQYSGNNPTLYIRAGETLAFNLSVAGHPFMIRVSNGGANYNTGLTHVAANGVVNTDANAQGQVDGTLYWKVPFDLQGNTYVYQCSVHSGMVGNIVIEQPTANVLSVATSAYGQANAAYGQANTGYAQANAAYGQANTAYAQANAAYGQANTAYTAANNAANTVRVSQNSASTLSAKQLNFVNTANVTITVTDSGDGNANVAIFSAAGGGGGSALTIKDDGTTLNTAVTSIDFVGSGVTATANGSNVTVSIPTGLSNTIIKTTSFTATNAAANLTYTLPFTPVGAAYFFVIKNGIVLLPNTDYSVSNTTLTVIESGAANDVIEVRYFDQINIYESPNTQIVVDSNTVVAQTNTFTLTQNVSSINRLSVAKNGLLLTPNLHFSVTNNTVTLNTVAEINDVMTFTNFRNVNDIAGGAGLTQYTYNTSTSSIETVDQWSKSTYRSAKYQMQVESGSGYQSVDIMVLHDGVDTNTIQYGSSTFGANVGAFTSDINGSNVRLRFTATDPTSYLTYFRTILANRASESLPTDLMTGSDTYDLLVTLPFHPTDLN